MKAVTYAGANKMSVSDHPKPKLKSPTDAILRVTTSGICGSDLHMYEGRTPLKKGTIVGHEIMGVIDEIGEAVSSIKKGHRIVLPFNIACGFCYNCHRGNTHSCLTMNPEGTSAGYGYAGMGPYSGGQAEFVLVPHADFNCLKLPGTPGDEWEDDFLLLSDVFPTGFHATELARVTLGKTVAIFGAGPVGLLAAYSSILKGASEVYMSKSRSKTEELSDTYRNWLDVKTFIGSSPMKNGSSCSSGTTKSATTSSRLSGNGAYSAIPGWGHRPT